MAKGSRLLALRLAEELLVREAGRRSGEAGVEAYVHDRGPRAPPRLRYEAGVAVGIGKHSGFGFRTECVYAPSWDELPEAIREHVRRGRVRGFLATEWLIALAICCAEGRLDLGNAKQFCVWLVTVEEE